MKRNFEKFTASRLSKNKQQLIFGGSRGGGSSSIPSNLAPAGVTIAHVHNEVKGPSMGANATAGGSGITLSGGGGLEGSCHETSHAAQNNANH